MRIFVAILFVTLVIYRCSFRDESKVPAVVYLLLMFCWMYRLCTAHPAKDEEEKPEQTQIHSDNYRSEEEWKIRRGLRKPSEPEPMSSPGRPWKRLPVEKESRPKKSLPKDSPPPCELPAGPVCPPLPMWRQLAGRLFSATLVTFCYLLLAINVIAFIQPYYFVQNSYQAINATVVETALSHDVREGKDYYRPRVLLRYKAGGISRDQWCDYDHAGNYRYVENPETDDRLRSFVARARAEKELVYSAGSSVQAWHEPGRPEMVIVPNARGFGCALALSAFMGVILFIKFAVVAFGLFRKALQHRFVYQRTTCRVLRGEVRSDFSTEENRYEFFAVLHVQCAPSVWIQPLTIKSEAFTEKSDATADLQQTLATHPIGQTTSVSFDPTGELSPTFESFGFLKACIRAVALVFWAPTTLVMLPFQVISKIERTIFPPRPERLSRGLSPSKSRDQFYVSVALLTTVLMIYCVLWPGTHQLQLFWPFYLILIPPLMLLFNLVRRNWRRSAQNL